MRNHISLGKFGEDLASVFLIRKGFTILDRNWRFSHAEIDIIAKYLDTLVFIEVKTRSSAEFGSPEEFISNKKMLLIQDAANEYMKKNHHNWAIRFDIISVIVKPNGTELISHFEDAWW